MSASSTPVPGHQSTSRIPAPARHGPRRLRPCGIPLTYAQDGHVWRIGWEAGADLRGVSELARSAAGAGRPIDAAALAWIAGFAGVSVSGPLAAAGGVARRT